jgi:hypothetical protein
MFKYKWLRKLRRIVSSPEFIVSVYPSGGIAFINTWLAHHLSGIPLYGLIIIFLVTASYTVALINWFTELYRKKSLKHKIVLNQLVINQFVLSSDGRSKRIRFGLNIVNNSDIPIFYRIELKSYHLAGVTNINMSNHKELDEISPRCVSLTSLPAIEILNDNNDRLGNLKFILSFGKKSHNLRYVIDAEVDIGLIFLDGDELMHEQNIKKYEYI